MLFGIFGVKKMPARRSVNCVVYFIFFFGGEASVAILAQAGLGSRNICDRTDSVGYPQCCTGSQQVIAWCVISLRQMPRTTFQGGARKIPCGALSSPHT